MKNNIVEQLKQLKPEEKRKKMLLFTGLVFVLVLILNLIFR